MIRYRPPSAGQALVEFALVIPIFLMLLFGLIDLARFVCTDSLLSEAAREGARLGAVEADWIGHAGAPCNTAGGPVCPANVTAFKGHITAAANRIVAGLGGSIQNVYVSCDFSGSQPTGAWTGASCDNSATGNLVSVRLVYTYQPFTPVIGQIIGSVQRAGAATMVIH
jgi:Flp pilus assembly protein TadG